MSRSNESAHVPNVSGRLQWLPPLPALVSAIISVALVIELIRFFFEPSGVVPVLGWIVTSLGSLITVRRPFFGVGFAACGSLISSLGAWEPLVEWSATVFLVFIVTLRFGKPVRTAVVAAVPTIAGAFISGWLGDSIGTSFAALITIAAAAAIGDGLRTGRLYREALVQRAGDAILTRELEANRRVAEERVRIARDLHDVVGHEVAVLSINLGVIEVNLPQATPKVADALVAARDGVRNVLIETQRMLVLLRNDDDRRTGDPVPDLRTVPSLVESYRSLGLSIEADIAVDPTRVNAAVQITVYRILQETLTNALRYGLGTTIVSCFIEGANLRVEVRNRCRLEPVESGSGLGLIGMTERVTAIGGTIDVGTSGPEFVVKVQLPLRKGKSE
jgi:signal transduction histidine kinase